MRAECPRGHKLTEDNVYISKNDGVRRCRKCRRMNDEAYRLRQNIAGNWNRGNTRAKPANDLTRRASADTAARRTPPEVIEDAKLRSLAPRTITSEFFGDPPKGWSALDRRHNA